MVFYAGCGVMIVERRSSYEYEDLLACGRGDLFGPEVARLPLPPMLMFDRILEISEKGGVYGRGYVKAELSIKPDLWFFQCHFHGDPVMPGCLGLDALWQLLGFYLGWTHSIGRGRALSVGKVVFSDQVLPTTEKVQYVVNVKRVARSRLVLGIADGVLLVNEKEIYSAQDIKVCLIRP